MYHLTTSWLLVAELSLDMAMSWRDQHHQRAVDDTAGAASSRTSLEAATEAAHRINALLIAQGMLKPSQVSSVPHKAKQPVSSLLHCLPKNVPLCYCPYLTRNEPIFIILKFTSAFCQKPGLNDLLPMH